MPQVKACRSMELKSVHPACLVSDFNNDNTVGVLKVSTSDMLDPCYFNCVGIITKFTRILVFL